MALNHVHLRKILKIMFLDEGAQRSAIRADIREEIARDSGTSGSGGDFYAPFWADARMHVFGTADIHGSVAARIAANEGRTNLYQQLRDGFLLWWNDRRRWTNEPFRPGQTLKRQFAFPGLDATIKVDSILSVRDGRDEEHAVYPYFAPSPILSPAAARLGLWVLTEALPSIPPQEVRILDVIRGNTFSLDRLPLRGDEEDNFRRRYAAILETRRILREEY